MMLWNYTMLILCILLVFRWWQMKRSIRKGSYDYSYYEEGHYGERRKKMTWLNRLKKFLKIK